MNNSEMEFTLVTSDADFEALQDEWNELLEQIDIANPFLTWEWMFTWWECYRSQFRESQLAILCGRTDGRLEYLLPGYTYLTKIAGGGGRIYSFLGSQIESSDYLQPISTISDMESHLADSLNYLLTESEQKPDLLNFYNVLEGSEIESGVEAFSLNEAHLLVNKHHRVCPCIDIDGNYEDYVQGLSKNMRYNLRRRTRKLLEKMGGRVELVTAEAKVDETISNLFQLHEARFESKGERSIFDADTRMVFHQNVSKRLLERGILRFFTLSVEEKDVAMLYGFEHGGEYFYVQAGLDPEWERLSAGMVLMGQTIKYSHDNECTRFDFMRGAEPYKFKWTQTVRNMVNLDVAVSSRGKQLLLRRERFLQLKEKIRSMVPSKIWEFFREIAYK